MDGEVWIEVAEIVAAVGISKQAIHKRLHSLVTRTVPGMGRGGIRYQLLLSSLPESWQSAYWQRQNNLPIPWQDALDAKRAAVQPTESPVSSTARVPIIARACPPSAPPVDAGSTALLPSSQRAVALSSPPAARTDLAPLAADDDTASIKGWQRDCLDARMALLQELDRRRLHQPGRAAMEFLCDAAKHGELPPTLQALVPVAVAKGGSLSPRTLTRWLAARDAGLIHLAPGQKGRLPAIPAWANALLQEWRRPQKPSLAYALEQLAQPGRLPDGIPVPSASAARRFLAKLSITEQHRGRLGPRALKNLRPYRQRDASGLWPLEVISMDGHSFDAEIAHPFHGQPFRPEITSAIDIATRKLIGWSVALAESALAVLDALRHAVQTHGIPSILYVDNGSGYHNALMEQQAIGFMARMGIEKTHSRPFNSQARGVIERLHQTVWVRLAKTLPTYIGADMDAEVKNRVYKITRQDLKAANRSRLLPAWDTFLSSCEQAVAEYNARPHSSLPLIIDPTTGTKRHQSPNEAWAELVQQNPDCIVSVRETEVADLFRPYKTGHAKRGTVRIFGNVYYAPELADYSEPVFIGYDLHDASRVWVRDRQERLIAIAQLNGNASAYVGKTALEQAHTQRAKARKARLERHLDEVEMELQGSRPALEGRLATPEEVAAATAELAALIPPEPTPATEPSSERPRVFATDLDLWRWVQEHPDLATERDRAWLDTCLEDDDFRLLTEIEAQKKSRLTNRTA